MLNPVSTGLTRRWLGIGRRQVPPRPATARAHPAHGPLAMRGVPSPGNWTVPAGERPGWSWLPEHGALPNLRAVPGWVRLWYRLPFIDRYAYEWMWWRGGWAVLTADTPPNPPDSGVREPLHTRT